MSTSSWSSIIQIQGGLNVAVSAADMRPNMRWRRAAYIMRLGIKRRDNTRLKLPGAMVNVAE